MPTIRDRLEAMRGIEANWDSYGADPPKPETLHVAGAFLQTFQDTFRLPEPYLTPTRVGGILAVWNLGPHELEVELEPKGGSTVVSFFYENAETEETASGEFRLAAVADVRPFALDAIARALGPAPAAVAG